MTKTISILQQLLRRQQQQNTTRMPLLRPTSRPTIHELTSFLLSPQSLQRSPGCLSLSRHRTTQPTSLLSAPTHRHYSAHRPTSSLPSRLPRTKDRGPTSTEDTQTDFGTLDVLGNTPAPSTSIDACLWDGFHLNSGVKITGGTGVLLVGGEAFRWCPWRDGGADELSMLNKRGQWEVGEGVWGVLELVWPKPDLLILGVGKEMKPLSEKTRRKINSLGIRVDIQDTRNAAAQFNLLATERGVSAVAAALIPIGWKEGLGVR